MAFSQSQVFNAEQETSSGIFYIFGIEENDRKKWSVLRYNPRQQSTQRITDMEGPRWGATFSAVEESILVVGGDAKEQHHSARVTEFVVQEGRWRERATLAVGRKHHAAAVLKAGGTGQALLGVFGGEGEKGNHLSSCEVFDLNQDRWRSLPNMREPRSMGPTAACLPGDCRVFVFGGGNVFSGALDTVEFCHIGADWEKACSARTSDFWQLAAPMRIPRIFPAATAFRGSFIIAGGPAQEDRVELFTPPDASSPRGQWTALRHMRQPRGHFTLLPFGDTVFALGNSEWPGPYNSIEAFSAPVDSAVSDSDSDDGQMNMALYAPDAFVDSDRDSEDDYMNMAFYAPDASADSNSDYDDDYMNMEVSAPDALADSGNDLKSWRWSSRNPVQLFRSIEGAVSLHP